MTLEKKILKTILRHQLITPGQKILIGVSGGADSLALLYILNRLRTAIGFQIHVAHINHHLRKSSDTDQRFVEKFCASHNCPCTSTHLQLNKTIAQGGSVEEIARHARLDALAKIAKKTRTAAIALAHHSDDLAETVLLRILRGTGLQGLQAILPKRKLDGFLYIRPMLDVSRDEIEKYLKNHKIKFRTDPTNKHTHFSRNKIRLQFLPYLEKNYQSNIKKILSNLAATAGEDYEYLRQHTLKILPKVLKKNTAGCVIDLTKFKKYPTAIQRMILRLSIERLKGDTLTLTLSHLDELEDLILNRPKGSIASLPRGVRAIKTKTSLFLQLKLIRLTYKT